MIVFITPYVLNTPEEMEADARRRADAASIEGMWKRGWSNSRLAEPNKADLKAAAEESKAAQRQRKEKERDARRQRRVKPEPRPTGMDKDTAEFVTRENERWDELLDKVDKEVEEDIRNR